ncbi:MAG: LptF/LptG family permease [Verrucomicrobiota bacterium]
MKIITRYFLFSLIKPLIYCVLGFYFLMIIFDLFGNADDFINSQSSIWLIVKLYIVQFPRFAMIILPVSFLVSALYVMADFSHNRETIGIQSAGISISKMARPFFFVAIIIGALLYFFYLDLAPTSEARRRSIEAVIKGKETSHITYKGVVYRNPETNTLWFLQEVDVTAGTFKQAEILLRDPVGNDITKLFVAQGTYRDGYWDLAHVRRIDFNKKGISSKPTIMQQIKADYLTEPPAKLVAVLRPAGQLTWSELQNFLFGPREHATIRMAPYFTEYYKRLAYPFLPTVLCLYAIALGVTHSRKNVGAVVLNCIFILLAFLVWNEISLALGRGARISPLAAGTSGIVLFGSCGLVLFSQRAGWIWDLKGLLSENKKL